MKKGYIGIGAALALIDQTALNGPVPILFCKKDGTLREMTVQKGMSVGSGEGANFRYKVKEKYILMINDVSDRNKIRSVSIKISLLMKVNGMEIKH